MRYETLRDLITEAQLAVYEANGGSASDGELADAVLAALGLDDWDEMLDDNPSGPDIYVRIGARVWESASTATGSDNG